MRVNTSDIFKKAEAKLRGNPCIRLTKSVYKKVSQQIKDYVDISSPDKLEEKGTDALLISSIPRECKELTKVSSETLGPVGGTLLILSAILPLLTKKGRQEYKQLFLSNDPYQKAEILNRLSNLGWGIQMLSTFMQNTILPSGLGLILSKIFGILGASLQIDAGRMEFNLGKSVPKSLKDIDRQDIVGVLDILAGSFWLLSTLGIAPTMTATGFVVSTIAKQLYTHKGLLGKTYTLMKSTISSAIRELKRNHKVQSAVSS